MLLAYSKSHARREEGGGVFRREAFQKGIGMYAERKQGSSWVEVEYSKHAAQLDYCTKRRTARHLLYVVNA